MKVTFSNGVEIPIFSAVENIDPDQAAVLLVLRTTEKLDLDTIYMQIIDGIDKIIVTEDSGATVEFDDYKKIAAIQNIVTDNKFEAMITLSKRSVIE